MLNNLLEKFDTVTIENETRISEWDIKFCETQQKLYEQAIQAMQQTLDAFKTVYEEYQKHSHDQYDRGYIEEYKDIGHTEDRIRDIKNSFISKIIYYFQRQYNVTLECSELKSKYDINVKYTDIIDEIFEQLGGFNFEEKAVNELKEKCRDTIYRDDKITIKKGKISIQDFVWWNRKWDDSLEIGYSDSKVSPLMLGLSHYETGMTERLGYYSNIYDELYRGEREYDIFKKYELGYNKVKSLKFFKNGKIEIVFNSNEQAEEFAKEYLKYQG